MRHGKRSTHKVVDGSDMGKLGGERERALSGKSYKILVTSISKSGQRQLVPIHVKRRVPRSTAIAHNPIPLLGCNDATVLCSKASGFPGLWVA